MLVLTGERGVFLPLRLSVPATVRVPGVPEGIVFVPALHTYFRFFPHLHDVELPVMSVAMCSTETKLTHSLTVGLTYVGKINVH